MDLRLVFGYLSLLQLSSGFSGWFYNWPPPGLSTQGGVWPLPWSASNSTQFLHTLDPSTFKFTVAPSSESDVLQKAFERYKKWAFPDFGKAPAVTVHSTLVGLEVTIKNNEQANAYPQIDMNEEYTLEIPSGEGVVATLQANEVWGALRGLETFSQLIYQPDVNEYHTYATKITDKPRFPYRGFMIDSARHFLTVNVIKRNLDLMAQNKMNVLHWHMVDSEAFTYPSTTFPALSHKGAYTPRHAYTTEQVKSVMEYARYRGIRVVAEFDTPGHMGGWGPGQPDLLTKCYLKDQDTKLPNIFDPSLEENYGFLQRFFKETLNFFPDRQMHFGGDEVSSSMTQCWLDNPDFQKWMKEHGYGTDGYKVLNDYFQRLFNLTKGIRNDTQMILWQDVIDDKVKVPEEVIVHVWKGGTYAEMMQQVKTITATKHKTIFSSCWYLNYIKYGNDWGFVDDPNKRRRGLYYECDPTGFSGTAEQKKLVLGGEVVMWAEFVDGTNLIERAWPRASAAAERLWSDPAQTTSAEAAWPRLHEHRCRMLRRGYAVQPINFPGYCPTFWDPPFPGMME